MIRNPNNLLYGHAHTSCSLTTTHTHSSVSPYCRLDSSIPKEVIYALVYLNRSSFSWWYYDQEYLGIIYVSLILNTLRICIKILISWMIQGHIILEWKSNLSFIDQINELSTKLYPKFTTMCQPYGLLGYTSNKLNLRKFKTYSISKNNICRVHKLIFNLKYPLMRYNHCTHLLSKDQVKCVIYHSVIVLSLRMTIHHTSLRMMIPRSIQK